MINSDFEAGVNDFRKGLSITDAPGYLYDNPARMEDWQEGWKACQEHRERMFKVFNKTTD